MGEGLAFAAALAGCVCQAFFIREDRGRRYGRAAALKTVSSGIFVLLGLVACILHPHDALGWLVPAGLALGMAGDVLHALRFIRGRGLRAATSAKAIREHLFAIGAFFFLAGHVAYLAYLLPQEYVSPATFAAAAAISAALLASLSRPIRLRGRRAVGGGLYLSCVVLMMCCAATRFVEEGTAGAAAFAAGAVFFLVSDTLLSINTFGPKKSKAMRAWSLATYYGGQTLIALSLWL